MEIIADTLDFVLDRPTAAALGKFDGIHMGHRRLLQEVCSCRDRGLASCVFTFEPSPAVFFGGGERGMLCTREEKRLLLARIGVDILIEFPLNARTAATPPEQFARQILAGKMKTRFLAAGRDLSFGAGGAGDAALLEELGPSLGFETRIIDKVCLEGREVSSTLVREKVEAGEMEQVRRRRGMPYLVAGKVVRGKRLGRNLGFPTVNLLPDARKLLPPRGVYFSRARLEDKTYRAISNVGYKPTVTDERVTGVETYLYDFQGDVYGKEIEIFLYAFHRPEMRFESVEALGRQLQKDIAAGAALGEWEA